MTDPKWSNDAIAEFKSISNAYQLNIKAIAEAVAKHDAAELVLSRDVQAAVGILDAYGHTKKPWYQRYEAEVGLGGFFMGYAGSVNDSFDWVMTAGPNRDGTFAAIKIVLLLVGLFLVCHGLLRGSGIAAVVRK